MPKNYDFQRKKGLSNLIQASIINKNCWFLFQLQDLDIKKSCRSRIFEFLIFFKILPLFVSKNSQIWKTLTFWNFGGKNVKNGRKNQNFHKRNEGLLDSAEFGVLIPIQALQQGTANIPMWEAKVYCAASNEEDHLSSRYYAGLYQSHWQGDWHLQCDKFLPQLILFHLIFSP